MGKNQLIKKTTKSKRSDSRISLLIPCYNEQATIRRCIESCLKQKVKPAQIIVVNDSSTDRTPQILQKYKSKITIVKTHKNTGNKSHAQEFGLKFVKGDIVITTDADTVLDPNFVGEIKKSFSDPKIIAVGGYVKSMKYNWITRSRAFEYVVGQNFHKLAQSYLDFMFIIPGAAGAFRTDIFRKYLSFEHDTVTEDLDFTYKLHKNHFKIEYNRNAIVYTQDPSSLKSYTNQLRRWFGGGWQNLMKHKNISYIKPLSALELSIMYTEGLVFSVMLFLLPILNLKYSLIFMGVYFCIATILAMLAAIKEKRLDLLLAPLPYMFLMYINAYVFFEQFIKEVILHKKNLVWFKPERVNI